MTSTKQQRAKFEANLNSININFVHQTNFVHHHPPESELSHNSFFHREPSGNETQVDSIQTCHRTQLAFCDEYLTS